MSQPVFGSSRDGANFPAKQGGIATQQADIVAEAIAAELEKPLYLQAWLGAATAKPHP